MLSTEICIILHIVRQPNSMVLLFIQNISQFLTRLPPRRPSSKLWPISRHGFRIQTDVVSRRYSSKSRIAVNAIFLAHFCPSSFISNQIYHRIDCCSHLAGDWSQSQKLRNGQIFLMNNNKICWTRYRIEKCITTCSEKTFDTSLDQSWLISWLDEKVAMNAATGQPEQT